MSPSSKESAAQGEHPAVDPRLARAARCVSSQLNASLALEIVRNMKQLLKEKPHQIEAHYFLAVAYDCLANRHVGIGALQRRLAKRHYRKVIESLPPSSPFAVASLLGLAANIAWEGRYAQVKELLGSLITSSDPAVRLRAEVILGAAAFRRRKWDVAFKHWHAADSLTPDTVTSRDPGLPGAWLRWGYRQLAEFFMQRRKWEKAYEFTSRLVRLDPMFLTPHDFRLHGKACEKTRRREEALEALNTALAMTGEEETEGPAMYMGERPIFMPNWAYAYDRLVDGSAYPDNDLLK